MEFSGEAVDGTYAVRQIGVIHSCFKEKFGIPRQAGMVSAAVAQLELFPPYNRQEMVRNLEQFSHIWVQFIFHQTLSSGWKATVRPPLLGGKQRVGVFASRTPHRPNHLGLSAVRLEGIDCQPGHCLFHLSGVDFLDQTPVIDVKPYLPYSDAVPTAVAAAYAHGEQPAVSIRFSEQAKAFCDELQLRNGRDLRQLIIQLIRHDPRPASQRGRRSHFGMRLWDVNVRWRVADEGVWVESCRGGGF